MPPLTCRDTPAYIQHSISVWNVRKHCDIAAASLLSASHRTYMLVTLATHITALARRIRRAPGSCGDDVTDIETQHLKLLPAYMHATHSPATNAAPSLPPHHRSATRLPNIWLWLATLTRQTLPSWRLCFGCVTFAPIITDLGGAWRTTFGGGTLPTNIFTTVR